MMKYYFRGTKTGQYVGFLLAAVGITALLFFVPDASAQSDLKVGYVDFQRIIQESQAGKKYRADFEKELKNRESIIKRQAREFTEKRQVFQERAAQMSAQARQRETERIQDMVKNLRRKRADLQDELTKLELELKQRILNDLEGIIEQVKNTGGYTFIIERTEAGVLYASQDADITDQVIKLYDKKYRGGGISKK